MSATPEGVMSPSGRCLISAVWARLRVVSEVLVDVLNRPGWSGVQMSSLLALPCESSCLTTLWLLGSFPRVRHSCACDLCHLWNARVHPLLWRLTSKSHSQGKNSLQSQQVFTTVRTQPHGTSVRRWVGSPTAESTQQALGNAVADLALGVSPPAFEVMELD